MPFHFLRNSYHAAVIPAGPPFLVLQSGGCLALLVGQLLDPLFQTLSRFLKFHDMCFVLGGSLGGFVQVCPKEGHFNRDLVNFGL